MVVLLAMFYPNRTCTVLEVGIEINPSSNKTNFESISLTYAEVGLKSTQGA